MFLRSAFSFAWLAALALVALLCGCQNNSESTGPAGAGTAVSGPGGASLPAGTNTGASPARDLRQQKGF